MFSDYFWVSWRQTRNKEKNDYYLHFKIEVGHLKLTLDNSIAELHEDDHDAIDGTHVDDDAMSQTHAGEETFHQQSTHESIDKLAILAITTLAIGREDGLGAQQSSTICHKSSFIIF